MVLASLNLMIVVMQKTLSAISMVNDLLEIVSSSNSPVAIAAVAADEVVVVEVADPAQDPLEVDMTDEMNAVAVVSVVVVAAVVVADDHIEPNGPCWSKISPQDAVGLI